MTDKGAADAAGQPAGPAEATSAKAPLPHHESGGDVHSYISARLRQAFDDVAKQPVPDRFLDLMRELDRS